LLAACLSLVGIAIKTFSRLFFIAPLLVLGGAPDLSVFNAGQLQALSLLLLKVNDQGAAIGLIFFGFYAVLKGYLIIKSTFLPRILGVLAVLAGLGLLTFLHCRPRPPRGGAANPVAHRVRRERTTVEGASRRGGDIRRVI
jgi:hypothetical protein